DRVAAEEREIHVGSGIARRLDVGALRAGPVLVVPYRHEDAVRLQQGAAAIRIDTRRVADVVALLLEPAEHREFGVEDPALAAAVEIAARPERPVVADLVGAPGR